jgi:hypothetical protein
MNFGSCHNSFVCAAHTLGEDPPGFVETDDYVEMNGECMLRDKVTI